MLLPSKGVVITIRRDPNIISRPDEQKKSQRQPVLGGQSLAGNDKEE